MQSAKLATILAAFLSTLSACGLNPDADSKRSVVAEEAVVDGLELVRANKERFASSFLPVLDKASKNLKPEGKIPAKDFASQSATLFDTIYKKSRRIQQGAVAKAAPEASLWRYTGNIAYSGVLFNYSGAQFVEVDSGRQAFVGTGYAGLAQGLLFGAAETVDGGICAAGWYMTTADMLRYADSFGNGTTADVLLLQNSHLGSCCADAQGVLACEQIL